MEQKEELATIDNDIQSTLFGPVIFLILTAMWFSLYFEYINFYSCQARDVEVSCFVVPIICWITWITSSLFFILICCAKIVKEKKMIDVLILTGYGSLYWFTLEMLFS